MNIYYFNLLKTFFNSVFLVLTMLDCMRSKSIVINALGSFIDIFIAKACCFGNGNDFAFYLTSALFCGLMGKSEIVLIFNSPFKKVNDSNFVVTSAICRGSIFSHKTRTGSELFDSRQTQNKNRP